MLWKEATLQPLGYDAANIFGTGTSFVPAFVILICAGLLFIVWVLPNSQEIMSYRMVLPVRSRWRFARWRPNAAWFAIAVGLFYWSLRCMVTLDIRPFTYFAF